MKGRIRPRGRPAGDSANAVRNLLVAALTVLALVACGGTGGDSAADYRAALQEHYVPLEEALSAAVEPCLAEDFTTCRPHMARARDQARMLLDALADIETPEGLENADEQFKRGLTALAEKLDQTLSAIDAHDDERLAALHAEQHVAGVDVNNALGVFNQELGIDLRPH